MKFCMVTTFYPPYNFGGDGIFVQRLAKALVRDGHEVTVVCDRDAYALLSKDSSEKPLDNSTGVKVHALSSGAFGTLDMLATQQLSRPTFKRSVLRDLLEGNDFDVIHYHNVSLVGGLEVLGFGEAVKLCTMHDYWFVCAMHVLWRFDREVCNKRTCFACTLAGGRPPQLWRYTDAVKRATREVDAFLSPSRSAIRLLRANGFPAAIEHLPHFLPEIDETPHVEPLHPRPYFLYAGRLEKIKGVQVLLEAFKEYDAAELVIAGDGNYANELRRLRGDLSHVHFVGRVDQATLANYYSHAIATLVPSLSQETFGWTTLESFARRTPVIAHNLGALLEVIGAGGGGLLYNTTDELVEAMEALRTQPELCDRLGQQGYESLKNNYSERKHLERYYELIEEIRERRRGEGQAG